MTDLKVPQAWTNAKLATTATAKAQEKQTKLTAKNENYKVVARIDMSKEVAGAGLCPDCKQPMTASHAAGHPILACHPCRIAMPMDDVTIAKLTTDENTSGPDLGQAY